MAKKWGCLRVVLIGLGVATALVIVVLMLLWFLFITPTKIKTETILQPEGVRIRYEGEVMSTLMDEQWTSETITLSRDGRSREIDLGGGAPEEPWGGRINIYRTADGTIGLIRGDTAYSTRLSDMSSLDDTAITPDAWVYAGAIDWHYTGTDGSGHHHYKLIYIRPKALPECLGGDAGGRSKHIEPPPFRIDKWRDCY